MNKLQLRRIESAIEGSKALEAAAPPPEPAAGPWEQYRDVLYDEIKDADDAVWAAWRFDSTANRKWGYAYARRSGPPMDSETTVWETSSGRNLCPRLSPWMRRNPDRIARINPPKEAEQ